MKYMKLGSKPDAFEKEGNSVRYVASELASDVMVSVGDVKFYLHKFPLLAKSKKLHNLILIASDNKTDEIHIYDFPGGPKAFEVCAKFCYGMTITLNAYNVVAVRCAADYLEMTETIDKGNLIYKIDVFLNSSLFCGWKDSITVLQTTKSLLPWSEELQIFGRCVDSIASKTSVDLSDVSWSYTYNRKMSLSDRLSEHGTASQLKAKSTIPRDWWIEDLCELDIELYKRVMVSVKAKGQTSADVIVEALRTYAIRWLPNSIDDLVSADHATKNRFLVETIIWLLPSDRGAGCFCSFLLKLLKVAIFIGIEDPLKEKLINRISLQLDKASVKDLLIPTRSASTTVYDVDIVLGLVSRFMKQNVSTLDSKYGTRNENVGDEFVLGQGSLLTVGKLIDDYLLEIAHDPRLPLSTFIVLSRSLSEEARPVHDRLYTAVDIYLQEHAGLTKADKKKICSLINVKKLSTYTCLHAAQNDRLPLRVIVQVLYFEQVRGAAKALAAQANNLYNDSARATTNVKGGVESPDPDHYKSIKKQLQVVDIGVDECPAKESSSSKNNKNERRNFLLPLRSRRIFDKLWVGKWQEMNGSSETSGSSQSPPTSVNFADIKSSSSCSRQRRNSIS